MSYRQQVTDTLLGQTDPPDILSDYTDGEDYLKDVAPRLNPHDTVLMFSDGAQRFGNKKSDCWVVFDLAPGDRYKKRYVLPGVSSRAERPEELRLILLLRRQSPLLTPA